MKSGFKNFGYKVQNWMQGRYGQDEFSKFLLISSLVFIVLFMIFRFPVFSFIAIGMVIYVLIRTYSKNISLRQKERIGFLRFAYFFRNRFCLIKQKIAERKHYAFFKCRNCRKILRVPKGKGKIKIRCPECGQEIIRRT